MTATPDTLPPFCKLAHPDRYVACSWDLAQDADGRAHWVPFFKRHFNTILKLGVEAAVARGESLSSATARADVCRDECHARFDDFAARPHAFGVVNILTIDAWRDTCLSRHGFVDPFLDLKDRENEKMLPLLSPLCRQLDGLSGEAQFRVIILGVFAGNIFDMGAEATAKAFLNSSPDFLTTRDTITPRPWLIDDYDAVARRMLHGSRHRKAIFFIDNAGSDFLLGALPFARWMAQRGTRVVLAANERPTLNDMTVHDVRRWWPRVVAAEPSLSELPIDLISTGTGEPLIDLSRVSPALNDAAADADLVILEGMGRGVESNLDAEFTCDALNVAMLKDAAVAKRCGGKVFDVVCRFRTPAA